MSSKTCSDCGGPYGECIDLRGGFLPERVCRNKKDPRDQRIKELLSAVLGFEVAIEKLDEALASPEQISEDTRIVGGFVSSLNLVETEDQIVDRAIKRLSS